MVRGEESAERGAAVRCHPTCSDHLRGHRRLVPSVYGHSGLIRGPFGAFSVFKAATDFLAAWHNAHINFKETFALHEVLKLATTTHPSCLKGSTAVVDVDDKTMHDAFKKGVDGTR